jgi:hypothetical protein
MKQDELSAANASDLKSPLPFVKRERSQVGDCLDPLPKPGEANYKVSSENGRNMASRLNETTRIVMLPTMTESHLTDRHRPLSLWQIDRSLTFRLRFTTARQVVLSSPQPERGKSWADMIRKMASEK